MSIPPTGAKAQGALSWRPGSSCSTRTGYRRAVLWVLADNIRARAFYEHLGWLADGGRKMYEMAGGRYPEVRYRRLLA